MDEDFDKRPTELVPSSAMALLVVVGVEDSCCCDNCCDDCCDDCCDNCCDDDDDDEEDIDDMDADGKDWVVSCGG